MFRHVTNYAEDSGIYSVGASLLFATVYVLFFALYLMMAIRRPVNVYWALAAFCLIRIASFTMRTVLAASIDAAINLNFVIGFEIIFDIGYLILLYTSHGLVLDLEYVSSRPLSSRVIMQAIRNRHIFHLLLFIAVALAMAAGTTVQTEGDGPNRISNILNIVSTVFFLVLTVLQFVQTLVYVRMELLDLDPLTIIQLQRTQSTPSISPVSDRPSFGRRNSTYILLLISLLFLLRETFSAATMTNWERENEEALWFPFEALPEFLAVCLYAVPNLVPSDKEIRAGKERLRQAERAANAKAIVSKMNEVWTKDKEKGSKIPKFTDTAPKHDTLQVLSQNAQGQESGTSQAHSAVTLPIEVQMCQTVIVDRPSE
ncbi:hypothetical protein CPC08DRAFT_821500 [Agrocybe pediades]|nr:hypothetical protein CPC08DRAFT_821500 [Agrocybe pediades]